MFDPKTNKFPYPELTDHHYLIVKKNDGTVFDENYPYIDNSKSFKRKQGWLRFMLHLLVFLVARIRLGLKVKGKNNLKKNKELLKKGAISISNHVHMYDYLSVMYAIKPHKPYLLAWAPNVSGEMGSLVRLVGGIPIPEGDSKASVAHVKAIKDMLDKGGWLHIYPEGSMWEFYAPIRPFKRGAAHYAVECDKPIIPMAFSYRKPGWIRRKIFKQIACFQLNIGEPIFPNKELDKYEREIDLVNRSHDAVCLLAGIDPKENLYPSLFANTKRIDYYTTEYGVGYKGSK